MGKANETIDNDTSAREIIISRVLNAPRELVFKVWTEPAHIARWWGPAGFTNTISKIEIRPGGEWNFIMHGPDGVDYPNKIVYHEIVSPQRLVYMHGSEEQPDLFKAIITFEEAAGNKTLLTMRSIFKTAAARDFVVREFHAIERGNETIDKLEEHLAKLSSGEGEILVTRIINAPRSLVFESFTKPEHLRHWWGSSKCGLRFCEVDLRPGGAYRFLMGAPPEEYWVSGVYHEIEPPEKLVFSCGLENESPGHNAIWHVTFAEEDGKTRLTIHQVLFDLADARPNAENGLNQSLDTLDSYLANIDAQNKVPFAGAQKQII
jgi:uncharacterized protein YndB with AHSA1/START domain